MGRGEKVMLENCVVEDTVVFASGENGGGMVGRGSEISLFSCFQLGRSGNASSQVVSCESGGGGGLVGVVSESLKVEGSGVEGGRVETRGRGGCGGGVVGKFLSGELSFSQTYLNQRVTLSSTNTGGFGGCLEGEGSLTMQHCFSLSTLQAQKTEGQAFGVFGMKGNHSISFCNSKSKQKKQKLSFFFGLNTFDSLSIFSLFFYKKKVTLES